LWRENFANSDLPPPPVFTLEDRSDFSPESGIPDYPTSPDTKYSDPRTPLQSLSKENLTPKSKSEASTSSYTLLNQQQQNRQSPATWWSPAPKSGGSIEHDDKGKGSPVDGVVQPGALITLPPPREVARPELRSNSVTVPHLYEEEWVTVYGFSAADTNLVMREFEKCGVILKHVPGPRDANWMHILYQNHCDAQKAMSKNGMQINGALIVGVKAVDPMQRQTLNERLNNPGFMTSGPYNSNNNNSIRSQEFNILPSSHYLQNGNSNSNGGKQPAGTIAAPAKSVASRIVDLMFGF
jgi:nuclear pore complex protein Nup53